MLASFFAELAQVIDSPCLLSPELCAQACDQLNLPGNGVVRPFGIKALSDIDLMLVLASELDRYDLVLPDNSIEAELANAKVTAKWRLAS